MRQHDSLHASETFSNAATAATDEELLQQPARLTPRKFTNEHSTASLANGLLVCVRPLYHGSSSSSQQHVSSVVRIMQLAGGNDGTRKSLLAYPGPLTRGVTHKKTVIEFCEEQIRLGPASSALKLRGNSMSSVYSSQSQSTARASYTLMWNLLILLLRQNGVVVGTDISELLLKNRDEFPYETGSGAAGSKASSLLHDEPRSGGSDEDATASAEHDAADGASSVESANSSSNATPALSEEEVTEKFRNYLLYGSINEALDWATDNNLWGHALFLASKVDRRAHANVLLKFANKMTLNDPLQTLYQLMSGRTPNSVTVSLNSV